MTDSSDTDLSSSPESYQSCPDDQTLGGWKCGAESSLTTSGDYNTAVEDVDHQCDDAGSRTADMTAMQLDMGSAQRDPGFSRTTPMTTQMTAVQLDMGSAQRDPGFSRTTPMTSGLLNEADDAAVSSFSVEGIAVSEGGADMDDLFRGRICEQMDIDDFYRGRLFEQREELPATAAGAVADVGDESTWRPSGGARSEGDGDKSTWRPSGGARSEGDGDKSTWRPSGGARSEGDGDKSTWRPDGGARSEGDGLAAKSTGVQSGLKNPKDKEKLLSGASKKVCEMSDKLKNFLKETAARGKTLQQKLDKVESNKAEVESALSDHVKYLHSLLDYHHSQQQQRLKQKHKEFLTQLMVNKTEELKFEARLKDAQRTVEDARDRIVTYRDMTAASSHNMAAVYDKYHRIVSSRPGKKEHSLTYMVEIPQVTADDMQTLQGHYLFTVGDSKPPTHSPAPRWPGHEDGAGAGCGATATADQHTADQHTADQHTASISSKASTCSSSSSSSSSHRTFYPTGRQRSAKPPPSEAGSDTPPNSALRFSKENRAKEAATLASSTTLRAGASSSQLPQSQQASVDPREVCARLDSKQKLSETMASSSSLASVTSGKARRRVRSRRRPPKEKTAESQKEAAEPPKPVAITLHNQRAQPETFDGRLKEARGFASRPSGELWVVYGDRDPHLDRLSQEGKLLESCRIGGNAMHAASFSQDNVLLSLHSPSCQLKLLDERKETRETIKLPLTPTGLGVGNTGIAVSSHQALYWIPLDGAENQWIVQEKGSTLKHVCSCEVIILRGREIVCIADRDGHKVWFFEKLDSGEFTPLPLFTYASHTHEGKTVPFSPVCLSSLPASSFLAVLDAASGSVLMVDMAKNDAVLVISGSQLCQGMPSLITFALTSPGEDPKLWVASDARRIYLVSLAFLY